MPTRAPSVRRPRRRTVARGESAPVARRPLGFYGFHVRDVMTRDVVTVGAGESLRVAARRMVTARVSGLPVVGTGGRLVGVVSQKDLFRLLSARAGGAVPAGLLEAILNGGVDAPPQLTEAARRLADARVRDAMSRPPISVPPTATLDEAIGLLLSSRINRLPVVQNGRIVGIVTRHDLLAGVGRTAEDAAGDRGRGPG